MNRSLRIRLGLIGLILSASVLTACTVSVAGGLSGVGVSIVLLILFLAGTATTQTGCEPGCSPCLSIGPCLSPHIENNWNIGEENNPNADAGDDIHVGPCLSAPWDGGFEEDVRNDAGDVTDLDADATSDTGDTDTADLDTNDTDTDTNTDTGQPDADAHLGPCLSPPWDGGFDEPDAGASLAPKPLDAAGDERARILARLGDRLPEDVRARLEKKA